MNKPLQDRQKQLRSALGCPAAFAEIVTVNAEMLSIFKQIEAIAGSGQAVLLTGETGAGKELFAKALHKAAACTGPFVAVNIAGLDDNLFSDTLFGHVRGAFTGADRLRPGMIDKAAHGTLFLDEIGDLSPASQVKLLRLLQDGEYLPLGADDHKKSGARVVTATNQDLWAFQRSGRFRSDLNFRLRTHHINIPPLRKRPDDIPVLLDHFLGLAAEALEKKKPTPPGELVALLQEYAFPGNVRELQGMVFDAVGRHRARVLSLAAFHEHIARHHENNFSAREEQGGAEDFPLPFTNKFPTIREAIRLLVVEAMKQAQGNQAIAARLLGISRQALNKRLKNISEATDALRRF